MHHKNQFISFYALFAQSSITIGPYVAQAYSSTISLENPIIYTESRLGKSDKPTKQKS